MSSGERSRVLFCDFDGEFEYSDAIREIGFLVDQIRPESLRSVTVGEHAVYVFGFTRLDTTSKVLKIAEKLKAAELLTPIILCCRAQAAPNFLNHQSHSYAADVYIASEQSTSPLLDALEELLGLPPLAANQVNLSNGQSEQNNEELETYRQKVRELESELSELKEEASSLDKALEAQRNFYKPKLKAALEGQKLQVQSETERLKVRLSEIEAKLLEREARIKELEQSKRNESKKIQALSQSHKKAQESLRSFYQQKIRDMKKTSESKESTTEVLPKN